MLIIYSRISPVWSSFSLWRAAFAGASAASGGYARTSRMTGWRALGSFTGAHCWPPLFVLFCWLWLFTRTAVFSSSCSRQGQIYCFNPHILTSSLIIITQVFRELLLSSWFSLLCGGLLSWDRGGGGVLPRRRPWSVGLVLHRQRCVGQRGHDWRCKSQSSNGSIQKRRK